MDRRDGEPDAPRANRSDGAALALTAVASIAGLAVRLLRLGEPAFNYDETTRAIMIRLGVAEILDSLVVTHHMPPLNYLVMKALVGPGASEWAHRLPSALCGALAVPLVFLAGRRLASARTAAAAALLLALSPLHVQSSQLAREYGLLSFLCAAHLLSLLRLVDRGGKGNASAFVLTGALALYTHYFAAFALLAGGAWALLEIARRRRRPQRQRSLLAPEAPAAIGPRSIILASAAIALLFLPWIPRLFGRAAVEYVPYDTFEAGDAGRTFFACALHAFFRHSDRGGFLHEWADRPVADFLDVPSVVFAGFAAAGLLSLLRRRPGSAILLALSLVLPFAGAIAVVSGRSFMAMRYMLAALPAWLLLGAAGGAAAARLASARLGARAATIAGGALLALAVASVLGIPPTARRTPSGRLSTGLLSHFAAVSNEAALAHGTWKETALALAPRLRDGDVVVFAAGAYPTGGGASPHEARNAVRVQAHASTIFLYYLETAAGRRPTFYRASLDGFALTPPAQAVLRTLLFPEPPRFVVPGEADEISRSADRVWLVSLESPADMAARGNPFAEWARSRYEEHPVAALRFTSESGAVSIQRVLTLYSR